MDPIQTLDLTEATPEASGLEEAYQIQREIEIYKKRIKNLEERRAGIVDDAILAGTLTQADSLGNRYELKATDRTVRTLDEDLLFQRFPDVFKLIAKPVIKVSIKDAEQHLGKAQIDECSTTKTSTTWKLEYVLGENAGLGKKTRAAKGVQ